MENLKIGCVLLASGNSTRFGRNKLIELFHGETLFSRALAAIPPRCFERIVVVSQYRDFAEHEKDISFTYIHNSSPEKGVSHTIRLGLSALDFCDGVLFCVSDQPLLRRESVAALVALHSKNRDKIAALASDGTRGNPCIFPARFFPALMALTGDRGGRSVIRANEDALVLLEAQPQELWDIDTPDALRILQEGL